MEKDFSSKRVLAFDGLRGLAILWVLFHNGALDGALDLNSLGGKGLAFLSNSGWLGVQLFFVLSGFLITGILLDAKKRRESGIFKRFYIRRALRIFPVYYVFLLTCFAFAIALNSPPEWLLDAYDQKWWLVFYVGNWLQPFEDVGLSHLWSLAVEEQFYLIWPFVIILFSRENTIKICLAFILIAPMYRIGMAAYDFEFAKLAAYVPTIARIDALAAGALLALMIRRSDHIERLPTEIIIIALISGGYLLVSILIQHNLSRVTTGFFNLTQTVSSIFFACLLFWGFYSYGKSSLSQLYRRILESRFLTMLGKYSYAIYLFHLPVSLSVHQYITKPWLEKADAPLAGEIIFFADLALLLGISLAFAMLSWKWVEYPYLSLKKNWPMKSEK